MWPDRVSDPELLTYESGALPTALRGPAQPIFLETKDTSCIPDKDIRMFYLDRQFLSHPCYITQDRIKIMCI